MIRRRTRLGWIAAITMIAVLQPTTAFASSPPQWGEPEPVSSDMVSNWFPDQSTDAAGNVFVIWEAMRDIDEPGINDAIGSAIMLSHRGPDGWSQPADIFVKDIYNAARPMIVSDGTYAHVIARALRGGGSTPNVQNLAGLYYMRAPLTADLSNVHTWSEPIQLSRSGTASYWAQLAVTPDGTLVTVYNELHNTVVDGVEEPRTILFSRRSTDQGATWSAPVRISTSIERVARTSIAVSPDGRNLLLSWDQGYDNLTGTGTPSGIVTAMSDDGGATWHGQQRLGGPHWDRRWTSYAERGLVEQSLVVTNGNTSMIIYRSTVSDVLLYRVSANGGRSWSDESLIPGAIARPYSNPHNFEKLSAAFDGDGRLVLAYVGLEAEDATNLSVMMTSYADGEWSTPEVIATPEGFPEYPRVSIALGNQAYLTYFVRDVIFVDGGQFALWRVEGESDAVPIAPVANTSQFPPPAANDPAVPSISQPRVEIASPPERPGPPEQFSSDRDIYASPASSLTKPVQRAMLITLAALAIACSAYGVTRVFKNTRI